MNVGERARERGGGGGREKEWTRVVCCIRIAISSESANEGAVVIRPLFLASFFAGVACFCF